MPLWEGTSPGLGVEPNAAGLAAATRPDWLWRQGRGLGFPLNTCETPVTTRFAPAQAVLCLWEACLRPRSQLSACKNMGVCPSSCEQARGW